LRAKGIGLKEDVVTLSYVRISFVHIYCISDDVE